VGLAEFDRLLFLHDGHFTDVTAEALRELLASDRDWTGRPVAAQR
jgi:hypothetical protein